MIECLALSLATLALTGGCSENPSGEDGMPRVKVGFAAPDIEPAEGVSAAAAPGSKAALADKTTVRVIVFRPNSGTPSSANYIAEQTYYMSGGKLVPCTVNADGSFKAANTDGELSLPASRYDFFAVTPALPLSADHMTVANVPNGVDFAMSVTANVAVDTDRTVTLTQLARKCANMNIVVQNAADNTSLTAVSVTSGGAGVILGNLAPAQSIVIGNNKDFTPASGTTPFTVAPASFTKVSNTKMTGSVALLPRLGASRMSFSFDLTYTVSGTTTRSTFTGTVGNLVLEKGKAYTLTLTMKQAGATLVFTDWNEQTEEIPMGNGNLGYPYISAGTYVVCKDDRGQATFPLHEPWTVLPMHTESDPENSFSARFEVHDTAGGYDYIIRYRADSYRIISWDKAVSECNRLGNGWRLPTRTEMMFICRYEGFFTSFTERPQARVYWSGTSVTQNLDFEGTPTPANYVWVVSAYNRINDNLFEPESRPMAKDNNFYFRCVRDIE